MKKATVFEVGPRDGLQNHRKTLSLAKREGFVRRCVEAGLSEIEVGSFVRADRIPQLADTEKLIKKLQKLKKKNSRLRFWAFVPNQKGLENALKTEVDGLSFFTAASETFCQKNVNRSRKQLRYAIAQMVKTAKKEKRGTRAYVSTITFCPYEGHIRPSQVMKAVEPLLEAGVQDISLGDTTGHATPKEIGKLLALLTKEAPASRFSMHLHDTRALSLANVWESLQYNVSRFDSSLGGLGGCPYAPGAAGNLPTEDLVYALARMGLLKNLIDIKALAKASFWLEKQLKDKMPSKVLQTLR